MEPSYVLIGMLVAVSSLILYVNAQVGLYYLKLCTGNTWLGKYAQFSLIDVGPQICSTGDLLGECMALLASGSDPTV